jgi:hypothetical protein
MTAEYEFTVAIDPEEALLRHILEPKRIRQAARKERRRSRMKLRKRRGWR